MAGKLDGKSGGDVKGDDDVEILKARLKKAEDDLEETQKRCHSLYESMARGVIQHDAEGRIVSANPAAQRILGFSQDRMKGRTLFDLYQGAIKEDGSDFPEDECPVIFTIGSGKRVLNAVMGILNPEDKRLRWIRIDTMPIFKDGKDKPDEVYTIFDDITGQKHYEQKLRHTMKDLARSNAELGTFVYSVAHDLRSPLRTISGFASVLLTDYCEKMDPEARDYACRIVNASRNMDAIINDLMYYSRIDRADMEFEPMKLHNVVGDVLMHLDLKIKENKAQVMVEKPMPYVLGNRDVLTQVIDNLVSNAIKFTAAGVSPVVRIRAEKRDKMVRLWVEDNGVGIEEEYIERIFRPFERLHSIDEYPGTGIGLAIVFKGARRMGGSCGVESTQGVGSRFWLEIPAAES